LLFGKNSAFIYNVAEQKIEDDSRIDGGFVNLQVLDGIYLYGLIDDNEKQSGGFYFQNINTLLDKNLES
jgi:hypothetical protein